MIKKRRICLVTTSRADFGIYMPVMNKLLEQPDIDAGFFVTGQHFRRDMGYSIDEIHRLNYPIFGQADISKASDDPAEATNTMARCMVAIADYIGQHGKPDMVIALGDRYEMLAAIAAVHPFLIPVAHIHGGEETEGAFDNAMRHALTKLSHLHFASTPLAAKRIAAMGEKPEHIIQCGAPALDNILALEKIERADLQSRFNLPDDPYILTTFHPETLTVTNRSAEEEALLQLEEVLAALRAFEKPVVFTASNIDPGGVAVNNELRNLNEVQSGNYVFIENFGAKAYFSAIRYASMMVGNTSSGILESGSFHIPVVDLGDRQKGRETSGNVINSPLNRQAILDAMKKADEEKFRHQITKHGNVYGDGNAADRIIDGINAFFSNGGSIIKQFMMSASDR